MKILVGSFQCESNTFSDEMANIENFEVYRGQKALKKLVAVNRFKYAKAKVIPLIFASALPSGKVKRAAFEYFKNEFCKIIKHHTNADGIYLYLHGSMYVDEIGSGEEALVKAIRNIIGYNIPISIALDFHANLSDGFIKNVNAIEGFRTAPHIDHDDTELRAAEALLKCILKRITPSPQRIRLPFLGGDASTTDKQAFCDVTKKLKNLDVREDIISCAFFNGQPWYDSEYTGNCAVVSALQSDVAKHEAYLLAKTFWNAKDSLQLERAFAPKETVEESIKNKQGIVFVTDSGDNTTAGAKGTGTLLLNLYLEKRIRGVLICGIFDKEITDILLKKEIGEKSVIVLCEGKKDKQELETKLEVTVKTKGIVYGWTGEEAGEGVCVNCGYVDVVLTNVRAAFTTPEHFTKMGIIPQEYKIIVLKMGYLFPKLKQISKKMIFSLTPGLSTNVFSELEYKQLKRRMFPIDKNILWNDIINEGENIYETYTTGS